MIRKSLDCNISLFRFKPFLIARLLDQNRLDYSSLYKAVSCLVIFGNEENELELNDSQIKLATSLQGGNIRGRRGAVRQFLQQLSIGQLLLLKNI